MLRIVDVELDPIFPRVIWIFFVAADDWDVSGSGWSMGRSGDAFKEGRGASILHSKVDVFFDFIREGGYIGEVDDAVVFRIDDGKGECTVSFFHGQDWDHDVVCPCVHLLIVRMVPLVVKDGLAQGHCGINLGVGRMRGLQYLHLESVGFRRGRRKTSKVCFNLRWGGSGSRAVVQSVATDCSFEPREGALRGGCAFLPFWTTYPFEQCKQYFWGALPLS